MLDVLDKTCTCIVLSFGTMSSVQTIRITSEDNFQGYWLIDTRIVQNKNDALNFALKSSTEKVQDLYETTMRGIRDRKLEDYYVEKCMRPYQTSQSKHVGKNDEKVPARKRSWFMCCMRPTVKT